MFTNSSRKILDTLQLGDTKTDVLTYWPLPLFPFVLSPASTCIRETFVTNHKPYVIHVWTIALLEMYQSPKQITKSQKSKLIKQGNFVHPNLPTF